MRSTTLSGQMHVIYTTSTAARVGFQSIASVVGSRSPRYRSTSHISIEYGIHPSGEYLVSIRFNSYHQEVDGSAVVSAEIGIKGVDQRVDESPGGSGEGLQ